jgi:RNA polymerase sigma-70 factor (ECF subfamily)
MVMDFAEELTRLQPRLFAFACRLRRLDEDEAADLTQDTLVRAFSKHDRFTDDGKPGSLRRWCFTIMYNLHINRLRNQYRETGVVMPWPSINNKELYQDIAGADSVQENATWTVLAKEVGEAMDTLEGGQRRAIVEIAINGRSYDEAAEICDIPVGTIRSRLSRGRSALRDIFT